MRKMCVAVVSLLIWPEIDREGREGGRSTKMQENMWARLRESRVRQSLCLATYPTYFPTYLYEEREMNVGTSPP